MSARVGGILLGLVVLAPRLARILHPGLWDEDAFALASARLLAGGAEPYRDFDAPYLPVVEVGLALAFRVFGASVRVAEVATQAMQAGTALLLACATRRVFGRGAGIAAAAVFGASGLAFRYHLFEHEVPAALALAGAFALCAGGPPATGGRRLALAACLAASLLAKATVAAAVAGVLAWHLLATRDRRATARLCLGAVLPLVLLAGFLALRHGSEFWLQSVGLHLVKGGNGDLLGRARLFQREMDLSLAAGICGAIAAWRAPRGTLLSLALAVAGAEVAATLLLKTALWAHNLYPLLVPASVLGGAGLARGIRSWRRPTAAGLALGALFLLLAANAARHARVIATPGHEALYGFGFFPRARLEGIAAQVRATCPPDLAVEGSSPIFAFAAGRDPAVAFAEFHGVLSDLREGIRKEGLLAALRARRGRDFWTTLEACSPLHLDALAERVRRGEVGALVHLPEAAEGIARALAERGAAVRLEPEASPGPDEPRVYRVVRGP